MSYRPATTTTPRLNKVEAPYPGRRRDNDVRTGPVPLIPAGVWFVLAIVCLPVFAFTAVTARSYPEFEPLFAVLSTLIGACLLLSLLTELINRRNGRDRRPRTR